MGLELIYRLENQLLSMKTDNDYFIKCDTYEGEQSIAETLIALSPSVRLSCYHP